MNKSKKLPISCICSIYKKTNLHEFSLALDSLIIQEYIPDEIIIIVDGVVNSDVDKFLNFLKKKNDIFKVFYFEQNKGLGLALKFGIPKCKNELVARFDSDDINLKDRLIVQYNYLKDNPKISIVGTDIFEFSSYHKDLTIKKMTNNFKGKFKFYMVRNPLNHSTVVFRKQDIINVGSYKNIKFFEDYELWLRCLREGLSVHNIDMTLVAMKRSSYLSKRNGFKYAIHEFNFLKEAISQKTIKKYFIPIYILRILLRVIPVELSFIIKSLDSRRLKKKGNFDLKNYINKITKNDSSYSSIYKQNS